MLPSSLSRSILGKSSRQNAPTSQTAQLVGRSRSERVLDRLYNRQGHALREAERIRRLRALSSHKRKRLIGLKQELPVEKVCKTDLKSAEPKNIVKEEVSEVSSSAPRDLSDVISSLIKCSTSKAKIHKVIKLAQHLVISGYVKSHPNDFIDLLIMFSCQPSLYTTLEPEARSDIIALVLEIRKQLSVSDTVESPEINYISLNGFSSNDEFELIQDNDSDESELETLSVNIEDALNCFENKNDKIFKETGKYVSPSDWLNILSIIPLWHNMLLTDDTYQFHQALRRIENLTKSSLVDCCSEIQKQKAISKSSNIFEFCIKKLKQRRENCSKNIRNLIIKNEDLDVFTLSDHKAVAAVNSNELFVDAKKKNHNSSENINNNSTKIDKHDPLLTRSEKPEESHLSLNLVARPFSSYLCLPDRKFATRIKIELIAQTLPTIFSYGKIRWSRTAVTQYFQFIYRHRAKLFSSDNCVRIGQYQESLASDQLKFTTKQLSSCLAPGQPAHPVQDGRDEKIVAVHGASVWSAKQLGL